MNVLQKNFLIQGANQCEECRVMKMGNNPQNHCPYSRKMGVGGLLRAPPLGTIADDCFFWCHAININTKRDNNIKREKNDKKKSSIVG